jgi:transcriptional regulator with XRE-family HTH domain
VRPRLARTRLADRREIPRQAHFHGLAYVIGNLGLQTDKRDGVDVAGLSASDQEKVSLFVDEMRALREQRGWSQGDLARETNYSESLIAMVETYQRAPTLALALAKALDRAFQTPGFAEGTANDPGTPGTFVRLWHKLRTVSFPASFRSFVEHEEKAAEFRMFEHSLVPGLLQTEDYARATLSRQANTTEEQVAELLAARLDRQAVLIRKDPPPPLVWALLDEGLLYRPVGGPKVMHDQLVHLVALSERPNVTIQVLPFSVGGHRGLEGAFIIADFRTGPSILFLDELLGGRVVEEAEAVAEAALHFTSLRSDALPRTASRDLMMKATEERWTG